MPRMLDLYGMDYDFSSFDGCLTQYMLAAIPRSGSTHLSLLLWKTGAMGSPMEYPNPPFMDTMRKRLGVGGDYVAYWNAVKRARTSPNGVFGFKMFVSDYVRSGKLHPELLPEIAPDKVVFLTRSNLVEQAVSYSKAIRSGSWFHGVPMREKPVYDVEHIRLCIESLQYQADFWNELFTLTETAVHEVTYESLLADPVAVVRGVADFLNVNLDSAKPIDLPCMHTQRDTESAEWVHRYEMESATLAGTGSQLTIS